jgi:hypothetical protein
MKKYFSLLIFTILPICGIFTFFFFRMGTHDAKVLAEFPTAYKNYDQAMADYSTTLLAPNPDRIAVPSGLESKADQALAALYSIASERISS